MSAYEMSGHTHSSSDHGHDLQKPLLEEAHGRGQSHAHDHGHEDGNAHNHGHDEEHGRAKGRESSSCCGGHSHGEHGKEPHGHGHEHGHGHDHGSHAEEVDDKTKMKRAIYCALFFMMVEIVGGMVANSLAIVTDAAHMLSDVGGFIVSLLALQLSEYEATQEFSYGFKQAEVLGALFSIMIVWALTAVLLSEAIFRFLNPEEINAPLMFWIAVIGFIVNLVLMKVLGHGHAHGDGDDHGHAHGHGGGEEPGAAVQAAIAHVIGDIVQSLGVCLAALCIWLRPFDLGVTANGISKWNYADPCCTLLFGILVLFTTKSTVIRTISILMGRAPKHIDQEELVSLLTKIPNVDSVHDLHVWTLGSNEVLCTAHIMINGPGNATAVLKASIKVAQGMGIGHSTFQTEIVGEFDPNEEEYGNIHRNPSRHLPEEGDEHAHKGGIESGHSHGGGHGHAH